MKRESIYQASLIKKIQTIFPDCFIVKNDPSVNQGVPDLLLLVKDKWMMLETKRSKKSAVRPNQGFFVDKFNRMSYASFVHPDNEEQVLSELQSLFD
jgi:hypothetical protein